MDSIAIAVLASYLTQILKTSKARGLQWIARDNPAAVRLVSFLFAALTAAGISMTWTPETGTLTIVGLTAQGIATFIWTTAKQLLLQDAVFRTALRPFQPPEPPTTPPS